MPFAVCGRCGLWQPDRNVVNAGLTWATAGCTDCGHAERFRKLPLFVVSGPSGGGKSTVSRALPSLLPNHVVLESDLLWGAVGTDPEGAYESAWLRVVAGIHQADRSVVLCGTLMPDNLESRPERRYIGPIHMLQLVCDPDELAARLRARPAWRQTSDDAFIARHIEFQEWILREGAKPNPPFTVVDTTAASPALTAAAVAVWVQSFD